MIKVFHVPLVPTVGIHIPIYLSAHSLRVILPLTSSAVLGVEVLTPTPPRVERNS